MGVVAPNTAIEVIHVGNTHGIEVQNRFRAINLSEKASYLDLAVKWKDGFLGRITDLMNNQVMWHTFKIREHLVTGFTPYEVIPIGGVPGKLGGDSGPSQVAGVMTLHVKYFGNIRNGRFYVPCMPNWSWYGGHWDTSYLTTVNNQIASLTAAYSLTGTDPHFKLAVFGKANPNTYQYAAVKTFTWGRQPGVQRRRSLNTV